ncbi:hypothetical protein BJ138DRAFT_1107296 [Hygrophoropsis aurantiaca]|uniref:Uncharacterized protein n=1 Tax=Hygrophoropsis aurantiaca TaxID=72124 RepID=A0ACB7ZS35_9AGAM|nr:hypothetical protein BJ138DRAFT_1107296 [Hygrophoropsis aurantiaca]
MVNSKTAKVTTSGATSKHRKKRINDSHAAISYDQLCDIHDTQREAHLKASTTTKQYGEYVQRGRTFLKTLVEAKQTTASCAAEHGDLDEFSKAFDDAPNRFSSEALELFLVEKCLNRGLGNSTAWGVLSAYKALWDRQGDKYRGSYSCDEATGRVSGNPASSAVVKDILKTIENKNGANGTS